MNFQRVLTSYGRELVVCLWRPGVGAVRAMFGRMDRH